MLDCSKGRILHEANLWELVDRLSILKCNEVGALLIPQSACYAVNSSIKFLIRYYKYFLKLSSTFKHSEHKLTGFIGY